MTNSSNDLIAEMTLLGAAVYQAQKIEFALYGIASLITHLPEFKGNKKLRDLTPESFLRGDFRKLKATFGELKDHFAGRLVLSSPELNRFVTDRNLIVHNFFRQFHTTHGDDRPGDPIDFLRDFLVRGATLQKVFEGLLVIMKEVAAEKAGLVAELVLTEQDQANKAVYLGYVSRHNGKDLQ